MEIPTDFEKSVIKEIKKPFEFYFIKLNEKYLSTYHGTLYEMYYLVKCASALTKESAVGIGIFLVFH